MVEISSHAPVPPLSWHERISSMPYIPGGGEMQAQGLKIILEAVQEQGGLASSIIVCPDGKQRTIRESLKQLAPAGFAEPVGRNNFRLTPDASSWLESGDPILLIGMLHKHVRCVGELLSALVSEGREMRGLFDFANEIYDMNWRSLDQVRRRVSWFRSLGLAEYKTQKLIVATELGAQVSKILPLGSPAGRVSEPANPELTESEISSILMERALKMGHDNLVGRANAIGFIPRGPNKLDPHEAIVRLLDCASPRIQRDEFRDFCNKEFEIGESSFQAALSALMTCGFLEEESVGRYKPSIVGDEVVAFPKPINVCLALHLKIKFVLEILVFLKDSHKASEIARWGAENQLIHRVDIEGVRKRLHFLEAAGAVEQKSAFKYRATRLGDWLIDKFPLQEVEQQKGQNAEAKQPAIIDDSQQLVPRLRDDSINSANPGLFESSICDSFAFLGFETRLIGGSGDTDVLATTRDPSGKTIKVVVDAKSAGSGVVSEGSINFNVINEHLRKNQADHALLVGPSFSAGRTSQWAKENSVGLMDVPTLERIITLYNNAPLSTHLILNCMKDDAAREEALAKWEIQAQRFQLLHKIMEVLRAEFIDPDEVTQGALSVENIYLVVRDQLEPRPKMSDIKACMEILQNPLIGSLAERKGGFVLFDSLEVVAKKLSALSSTSL